MSAAPLIVVVGLILVSWARSKDRIPWWEVVYVVVWTGFGLLAFRNAPVAALMLAPTAAIRASHTFSRAPGLPTAREQRLLMAAFVATCLATAGSLVSVLLTTDPLEKAEPLRIARHMEERGLGGRVLNAYNASGVLVAFGPEDIVLGVDGRAERYGEDFLSDYFDVLNLSGDDWPGLLEDLDPQSAVIERTSAVRHFLESEWGWTVTLEDGDYLLLEPE